MKRFTGLMLLAVLSGGALLALVTPACADSALDQARQAVTDPNHVFDGAEKRERSCSLAASASHASQPAGVALIAMRRLTSGRLPQ